MILLREYLPGAVTCRLRALRPGQRRCWPSWPAPTPPTSPRRTSTGMARATRRNPPSLDEHHPAVGLGGPINRTLWTLIWGFVGHDLPDDRRHLHPRPRGLHAAVHPRRDRLRRRADHVLRRRDARLHRRDPLPPVPRQRPGRLGDRQPVPALLRHEHDRLRLPGHRHQARQRADRRPAHPGRLLLLVRPPPRRDQRRADRARACRPSRSSSPTRR